MTPAVRPADVPEPLETTLAGRLVSLVGALRDKGIATGTSETVDAAAVMEVIGLDDRERLRSGLAAWLVRRDGQREVFDQLFDLWFPAGIGASGTDGSDRPATPAELRAALLEALTNHDAAALREVARRAVGSLGRVEDADGSVRTWSALQTLDRLQPQTVISAAEQARLGADGGGAGGAGGKGPGGGSGVGADNGTGSHSPHGSNDGDRMPPSPFTDRLARDEVRRDVAGLRALVATEARRRAAELRGRERLAEHAVPVGPERTDFLTANRQQLAELRAAVRPLSRRLASRLAARRRRARRGEIDIRRTMRRSMSTGGVPMRPALRKPHPGRPELVLLCDVSGSVAGFSTFTMLLVQALSDQFTRVRVFAFVNAMDEVTELVRHGQGDLARTIAQQAAVTRWHGSSDYGESLADFAETYLDGITPKTAVIVLGDGRNNYGDPNLAALQRIRESSRRTFWLNPEPQSRWGSGDSCALEYAGVVDMRECRTIEQLSEFVTRLLPV